VSFLLFPIKCLVVDAEDALFGNPSFAFSLHEFPDAVISDIFQIFNLAHAVPGPVSFIQVFQPIARKLRAVAAEITGTFFAHPESAIQPGPGLVLLRIAATMARIPLPQIGPANPAVHSARGYEIFADRG